MTWQDGSSGGKLDHFGSSDVHLIQRTEGDRAITVDHDATDCNIDNNTVEVLEDVAAVQSGIDKTEAGQELVICKKTDEIVNSEKKVNHLPCEPKSKNKDEIKEAINGTCIHIYEQNSESSEKKGGISPSECSVIVNERINETDNESSADKRVSLSDCSIPYCDISNEKVNNGVGKPVAESESELAEPLNRQATEVTIFIDGEEQQKEEERQCRVCLLILDEFGGGETMQLGCDCKDDLGTAHRDCAESWFKIKGNRICEICGAAAQNIVGASDNSGFMEHWNDADASNDSDQNAHCWQSLSLCNFLLACMVVTFILLWLFRVSLN